MVTNVAWFLISAVALIRMRPESSPAAVAADLQVQFPGVPDTTGQMAVIEVLTGSMPAVSMPVVADGQRLAL